MGTTSQALAKSMSVELPTGAFSPPVGVGPERWASPIEQRVNNLSLGVQGARATFPTSLSARPLVAQQLRPSPSALPLPMLASKQFGGLTSGEMADASCEFTLASTVQEA